MSIIYLFYKLLNELHCEMRLIFFAFYFKTNIFFQHILIFANLELSTHFDFCDLHILFCRLYLGTPVADESEEIVPGKIEEETYFVAAQVQILKWKMVSQSVSLE